jgi:transposase
MPTAQSMRTLPIGDHGITAPTLWARLGDAPGRWESFRHLQAHAGVVPVTMKSGKQQRVVQFRFACDKSLRYLVSQVAFLSLGSSDWARAYYDQQRGRGHSHHQALRALAAKWLKIIFVMWQRQVVGGHVNPRESDPPPGSARSRAGGKGRGPSSRGFTHP